MKRVAAFLERVVNRPRYLLALCAGQVVISGLVYSLVEDKSFLDGVWWTFVTAYTVGYGDQYPVSLGGRVLAVILMSSMILLIVPAIVAQLISKFLVNRDRFSHEEQEKLLSAVESLTAALPGLQQSLTATVERLSDLHAEVDEVEEFAATNKTVLQQNLSEMQEIRRLLQPGKEDDLVNRQQPEVSAHLPRRNR